MEDEDPFILFFQQFPGLRRPILDPIILQDMEDDIVEEIPGVMLRIGLNDTTLTRALLRGQYLHAEDIIEETTDIDFLNDGALNATPLNIVLGGPTGQYQQPRHLKLAKLLILKGANPNIRIPNHDLESASESPLELILRYYLKLLEVFTVPSKDGQFKETYYTALETELMDSVGINGELGGLTPRIIVEHTRELLYLCLDNGGDPNLPTTDAARTVFHLALVAPIPDYQLIQRLLEIGANINHADVHNTTPLMDLILVADEDRILKELKRFEEHGQVPLLDSQNCTLQSALFRAAFQGKLSTAMQLIEQGAKPALCTRTQQENGFRSYLINQIVYTGTPAMLAPLLANSPCWWKQSISNSRTGSVSQASRSSSSRSRFTGHSKHANRFQALLADKLIREYISPLVDHGGMLVDSVAQALFHLIRCLTQHKHIADANKLDPKSAICMMFGEKTAGLRQLAVRAIIKQVLFSRRPNQMVELLKQNCVKHGYTPFLLSVTPSTGRSCTDNLTQENGSIVHEFMLEPDSELELSLEPPSSLRRGRQQERDIDRLLQEMNIQQPYDARQLPFNDRRPSDSPILSNPPLQPPPPQSTHESNRLIPEIIWDLDNVLLEDGLNQRSSLNKTDESSLNEMAVSPALPEEPKENGATFDTCDTTKEFTAAHVATFNSDNEDVKEHSATSSCDNNIPNKFTPVSSTPTPGANYKSLRVEYEKEKPADNNSQENRYPIKTFDDLEGLSQADTNRGKRLLLIQMLHHMDQATLSPVDRELVATHPDVDDQLMLLSRKLEAIRTNESSSTSSNDVTPEDLLLHYNSTQVSEPIAMGSSSDYGTMAMDSRNNDSDFTCDNITQEHKSTVINIANSTEKSSNDEVFDSLLSSSEYQLTLVERPESRKRKSSSDLAFDALLAGTNLIDNHLEVKRIELKVEKDTTNPEVNIFSDDIEHCSVVGELKNGGGDLKENRMQLDENWSLGSVKNLESTNNSIVRSASRSLQAINHSVEIVKSLDVNVTVANTADDPTVLMVYKHKQDSAFLQDCTDDNDWTECVSPSPVLTDNNSDDDEFVPEEEMYVDFSPAAAGLNLVNGVVPQGGVNVLSRLLSTGSDSSSSVGGGEIVSPVLALGGHIGNLSGHLENDDESDEDSIPDSVNLYRERVATLKHTCCRSGRRREEERQIEDDSTVISYLSAQVLDALTTELGVPNSLRTCFALEVARLQLAMILASNHAIHCDRNCEGDDSDSENDEDEFGDNLGLDSDSDSDSYGIAAAARFHDQSTPVMDSTSSSSSSSSSISDNHSTSSSSASHFIISASVRSNFGSSVPSEGTVMDRQEGDEGERGEEDAEGDEDVAAPEHIFQPDLGPVLEELGGVHDESWESASSSEDWLPPSARLVTRRRGWLADQIDQRMNSRSWLEERRLTSSSWLEESENPIRRFLSDSPLPPDWYYSTSSESEDS